MRGSRARAEKVVKGGAEGEEKEQAPLIQQWTMSVGLTFKSQLRQLNLRIRQMKLNANLILK